MDPRTTELNRRVLVFAPVGRDAALTHDLLAGSSIRAEICRSIEALCAGIAEGAAAVVLTEEVFDYSDFNRVPEAFLRQPPWSDIPVLLFAGSEGRLPSNRVVAAMEQLPNVTLLDRPIRVSVALSVVRAAVRTRARQIEVRDLLEALEASREQAETANRLKDEFLATLSHELRTPLNAILGWTAMLRHANLDPARMQRGLEIIDRNARAQAQLVEDVLDMARVITGKLRIDFKPVSLGAVVEGAVEALRPAAEAKRIALDVESPCATLLIRGDAGRLQQVFWNLLSNAVKFTPEGGRVWVRIEQRGLHAVVSVQDSGLGLDPQFLPYVFDRFRQADQTVTRGHGGLGIGLAIVKHLVELHGGRVWAHSDGLGRGSTFSVEMPVPAVTPDRASDDRSGSAFRIDLTGRTLLVVDDDESTRDLLRELFEYAGATVVVATTAAAAFEIAEVQPLDAVIADIGLPGEDGLSLMRRIRSLPGSAALVPSVALSAYTRSQDREAATAAGFSEFVGKPAEPGDLLAAVRDLLVTSGR